MSFGFLRIYKSICEGKASPEEITGLYFDLLTRLPEDHGLRKWFEREDPKYPEMAIAIDAVAHEIHKSGEPALHEIYPSASHTLFKQCLDELSGMETDVRKKSRGYFTPILDETEFLVLNKSTDVKKEIPRVAKVTKEDIKDAIKEYETLHKAGLSTPAELLTLARYFPEGNKYETICYEKGYFDNEPLVVGGPASVEVVDAEQHLITMDAMRDAFKRFMDSFRTRNLMTFHSDAQTGWALPAYITSSGLVYKSGVDDHNFWLISELRDDVDIAKRTAEEIKKGRIRSYSIAGNANKVESVQNGLRNFMKVTSLTLMEVTYCEKGVNQGAVFDILKTKNDFESNIVIEKSDILEFGNLSFNNFGLYLSPTQDSIIITADRPNSITDEIVYNIQKSFPDVTISILEHAPLGSTPLFKAEMTPWEEENALEDVVQEPSNLEILDEAEYRPAEEEYEECHVCLYFSEGWCTKLHLPVDEEYTCKYYQEMPGAEEAEQWAEVSKKPYELMEKSNMVMDNIHKLKDWLEKAQNDEWDVSDGEDDRRKAHRELLDKYGFPPDPEDDEEEETDYSWQTTPWVVT